MLVLAYWIGVPLGRELNNTVLLSKEKIRHSCIYQMDNKLILAVAEAILAALAVIVVVIYVLLRAVITVIPTAIMTVFKVFEVILEAAVAVAPFLLQVLGMILGVLGVAIYVVAAFVLSILRRMIPHLIVWGPVLLKFSFTIVPVLLDSIGGLLCELDPTLNPATAKVIFYAIDSVPVALAALEYAIISMLKAIPVMFVIAFRAITVVLNAIPAAFRVISAACRAIPVLSDANLVTQVL